MLNSKDGHVIKFTMENGIPSFSVEEKAVEEKAVEEKAVEEKANYYDCPSFFNFLTILTKCNPFASCIPKTAENIGGQAKKDTNLNQ